MKSTEWIVLDTETTGLFAPIYILEIYAQLMRGWEPAGDPFHAYLNHGVPVPLEATAIHGITTEFLASNGREPLEVHGELLTYLGTRPVTAHNLSYDWDHCLMPEWARLSLKPTAQRGFCSMLLGRRVLPETKTVALQALKALFEIEEDKSHTASGDVRTLLTLLIDVYGPRLEAAGITSYTEVLKLSRKTPIRQCHAQLFGTLFGPPLPKPLEQISGGGHVDEPSAPLLPPVPVHRPYRVIDFQQGTQEWLRWRHDGIGASDAPIIMGQNPWRGIDSLLFEKILRPTGRRLNEDTNDGVRLEPQAREAYCCHTEFRVEPRCIESLDHSWLRASLDGITSMGELVLEIKCGTTAYRHVHRRRTPPDYYYGQLQHILMLTGLPSIDYWAYVENRQPILLTIERDESYIAKLFNAEKRFWDSLSELLEQADASVSLRKAQAP